MLCYLRSKLFGWLTQVQALHPQSSTLFNCPWTKRCCCFPFLPFVFAFEPPPLSFVHMKCGGVPAQDFTVRSDSSALSRVGMIIVIVIYSKSILFNTANKNWYSFGCYFHHSFPQIAPLSVWCLICHTLSGCKLINKFQLNTVIVFVLNTIWKYYWIFDYLWLITEIVMEYKLELIFDGANICSTGNIL